MICEKEKCVGCAVCASICPQKCIRMEYDEEGFLYPIIDEEKCISCGLCTKKCVALKEKKEVRLDFPLSFSAYHHNSEILKSSTSGGIFSALAQLTLNRNGYVAGAIFEFPKVFHKITNQYEEVEKMRGSKYLQSNMNQIYSDIKEKLDQNYLILFTGCPCQVAALYTYLGKPYSNLLTMDLVCHGVPSQRFFEDYIKEQEKKYRDKVVDYRFRSKKKGWYHIGIELIFEKRSPVYHTSIRDDFMGCYFQKAIYRPSCYTCPFARFPRVGDITVGDFFGIDPDQVGQENFKKGISLLLINSEKGKQIIQDITDLHLEPASFDLASKTNHNLEHYSQKPVIRDTIFKLNQKPSQIKRKYCQYKGRTYLVQIIGEPMIRKIKKWIHS